MLRAVSLISVSLFLASCASCGSCGRRPVNPPSALDASAPDVDAEVGDASSDVDVSDPDLAPDAETPIDADLLPPPPPPPDPCVLSLLGPARGFCDSEGPFFASVDPASPSVRSRLATLNPPPSTPVRLVVRHANGQTARSKLTVVLTNAGQIPGSFVLLRKGVAGPTKDLHEGERLAAERLTTSGQKVAVSVAAGKSVRFDASIEVGLQEGYATMGLYEYSFNQPHTLKVCMLGEREDFSACPGL